MISTQGLLWTYVALAFATGLALVFSRWPRGAKALLVAAVTALYFVADGVLDGVWGWPSSHALPARFVLLAAVVEEPNRKRDGALYVWVNALEDGKPAAQPRAYRLPYTKDLHALLAEGISKTRQGISQMGSAEPKRGPKAFSWLRASSDEQQIKIRDLPQPQLPEK